jgi:hypothetical protein
MSKVNLGPWKNYYSEEVIVIPFYDPFTQCLQNKTIHNQKEPLLRILLLIKADVGPLVFISGQISGSSNMATPRGYLSQL